MNFKTILALALLAGAIVLSAVGVGAVSAMGLADYQSRLQGAGYTVTVVSPPVSHATLKVQGTVIKIEKGGLGASVELLDYKGDRDALKTDWNAVNGQGPSPRVATGDFAGKVLYWNDDSVLAVSFKDPNFREAAQAAADIFLGARNTGGPGVQPSTGGTKLPATGDGASTVHAGIFDWLLVVALVGGAGCAIICTGAALGSRRGR
jgi:hypothetical protein